MLGFGKRFFMPKKIDPRRNGFTLVEIAIVITIITILLIPALKMYDQWLSQSRAALTEQRMNAIQQSLNNFMNHYDRLPCPSSFIAQPGDAAYGREAAPSCMNADGSIYTPDGKSTFAATGRSEPGKINPDIIIGTVPVRDLGLPDITRGDAYGHLFTYAVTAAETKILSGAPGVIDVVDAHNKSVLPYVTDPADPKKTISGTAVYVLVNHGKDGKGAYMANPGPRTTAPTIPCASKPGLDVLNCSFENNPAKPFAFRNALYSNNPGPNWFDDSVVYYTVLSPPPVGAAPVAAAPIVIQMPAAAPQPAPVQQQPVQQQQPAQEQQLDSQMQQQLQNLMQSTQDIKQLQQELNQMQPNQ